MAAPEQHVLVASVIAVFERTSASGSSPEDVAASLLEHEDVSTVRISAHGERSAFRVDVGDTDHEVSSRQASDLARRVAVELDLDVEVVTVGLLRDDDRVEVFRIGDAGDDIAWGAR